MTERLNWTELKVALVVKSLSASAGDVKSWGFDPWVWKMEEGMATHSSIPAWRILRTEETGVLQSVGSHRVSDWSDLAHRHPFKWLCVSFCCSAAYSLHPYCAMSQDILCLYFETNDSWDKTISSLERAKSLKHEWSEVIFIKLFGMKGERAFKQTLNNGKINENVLRKRNWPICLSL